MTLPVPMSALSLHAPIALDDVFARYPTLGATIAHESRSTKYQMISTRDILRGLYDNGFRVHGVSLARIREKNAHKRGYEKHMVRLRHVDAKTIDGAVPEVVLKNSHDGSSSWEAFGGLLRFICSNGLVIGSLIEGYKVRHTGEIYGGVLTAVENVSKQVKDVIPAIEAMRGVELNASQREEFAARAHALRFERDAETGEHRAPVSPLALLQPRRIEDATSTDLWTTFNVVQENLVKGGLKGRIVGNDGRMRRAQLRAINGIDGNVDINRRLFDLAHDTYRDLIAA